jgi:hypothetical protein
MIEMTSSTATKRIRIRRARLADTSPKGASLAAGVLLRSWLCGESLQRRSFLCTNDRKNNDKWKVACAKATTASSFPVFRNTWWPASTQKLFAKDSFNWWWEGINIDIVSHAYDYPTTILVFN